MLGSEFIVVVAFTSALVGIVTFTITLNPAWAIVATFVVILAEFILLRRLVSRRREIFINQLCDCLTTVSNALRAGFSFMQAMELISREMEPPISEEFQHVMRDISYGMLMDQALEDMDKRVGVVDFHLVVTAVLIQREIGGNLAQVLDSISETISNRIRMRREILTLTTQGRASSWIVSALPAFIAFMMILVDEHHFDEMLENQFGMIILGVAVVMEIAGFLVIRKIVDIKVE